MKRALGDLALHRGLLLAQALLQWGIAEPLHLLKFLATALADVFVDRHLASVSNRLKERPQLWKPTPPCDKINLLALYLS